DTRELLLRRRRRPAAPGHRRDAARLRQETADGRLQTIDYRLGETWRPPPCESAVCGLSSAVSSEAVPVVEFPDPRSASPEGIVAVGGDLHPQSLLLAYRQGIFPWPVEGLPLLWFSPAERGVLEFATLHVPRSLARARRRSLLRFTIDTAFAAVI